MAVLTGKHFLSLYEREPIVSGPGVTKVAKLSDYFPKIKNTVADTDVYFLEGKEPGGTVMIFGGVHAIEVSGVMSAILLVENATVKKGRLIVVPRCNESGFSNNAPSEGYPSRIIVNTPWGSRWFRFGDRLTNPVHQWPDPEIYVHYPTGDLQADFEVRNLDRAFPGRPDGGFTEKLAYALSELVRKEKASMTIDLHEARPMNPIVNCIIAHERAAEIAAIAVMDLSIQGIKIRLEPSPKKLRGMTHRELGDHTPTIPMLMETANPALDKLHGRVDQDLILLGKDDFFKKADSKRLLYAPYGKDGYPIEERVGRHLTAAFTLIQILSELYPDKTVEVENIPAYAVLKEKGIGSFLLNPNGRL
ncbi:MAG TPA: succinylglutamate desuccinylase/aspartoacylase family protein [Methanothrix sp.]|nr:succinylglutamate desuccinylase/aspartoacylase family protein [Methanothrix sp.]